MEVKKFIKKTLQILASVASSIILLAMPASLIFVAIGSSMWTIVTLSLALWCEVMGVIAMSILLWEEARHGEQYRKEARYREEDADETIVSESG